MTDEIPRFVVTTSRQFASWLASTGANLAVTTYQSGKILLFGSKLMALDAGGCHGLQAGTVDQAGDVGGANPLADLAPDGRERVAAPLDKALCGEPLSLDWRGRMHPAHLEFRAGRGQHG